MFFWVIAASSIAGALVILWFLYLLTRRWM
jgi:hypothetical protein